MAINDLVMVRVELCTDTKKIIFPRRFGPGKSRWTVVMGIRRVIGNLIFALGGCWATWLVEFALLLLAVCRRSNIMGYTGMTAVRVSSA